MLRILPRKRLDTESLTDNNGLAVKTGLFSGLTELWKTQIKFQFLLGVLREWEEIGIELQGCCAPRVALGKLAGAFPVYFECGYAGVV